MRSFLKPLLMIAAMALGMSAGSALPAWARVELNVNTVSYTHLTLPTIYSV